MEVEQLDGDSFHRSERLVLRQVQRGGATQQLISRRTGMPQQTVSRIVGGLIERGLIEAGERISGGRRGQPSVSLKLVPDYAYTIGVSIMLDAVAVALLDFSGNKLAQALIPMTVMTHDEVVAVVRTVGERFCKEHLARGKRLTGIGVGISGFFIDDEGTINTPHMLDEWALIDLRSLLADDFGLPVWIENDGSAAAIGEAMMGVGRWSDSFIYLYIATGLGGGVVLNGELARGRYGNAGELAEILPPNIYPHPNLELLRQSIARHGQMFASVSDMLAAFDPDWPGIDEWLVQIRDSLSLIVSAGAALLDPDVIVIGGRIPKSLAERLVSGITIYRQARRGTPRPIPKIVSAEAKGEPAAIGAAALPFKNIFFRE